VIKAVIDTNILVSALLTPQGFPAKIIDLVLNGVVTMCYDSRVIAEYEEVLMRPKFNFDKKAVKQVIDFILFTGISWTPKPLEDHFEDEDDKKFYEIAKSVPAYLVTGNLKHYPREEFIVTPQQFMSMVN
jgi:putative PIN family toxin of toxin-antitoxin system